ncbi:MAG: ribonuclease HII [Gammaproteobacteria bacterium]|nr:ribonuclease HII [Gammaproteobacteria bacterium]
MPRVVKTAPFEEEIRLWDSGYQCVAGTDEVGRGCLAGPVVSAAVVFAPGSELIPGVYDSKAKSVKKREELYDLIFQQAVAVGVGMCTPEEIDQINIREASLLSMVKAVDSLHDQGVDVDYVLVDGNVMPSQWSSFPGKTLVKGDARSHSIAAASIVAKVHRDRMMAELGAVTEGYSCWAKNKGYATADHYEAIHAYGLTDHHRKSFNCSGGHKNLN